MSRRCRQQSAEILKKRLPAFISPHNPLDLTTQPIWEPDLVGLGAKTLLEDPAIGALVISITVGGPAQSVNYMQGLIDALKGNKKPMVFSMLGDTSPLAPEFLAARARQPDDPVAFVRTQPARDGAGDRAWTRALRQRKIRRPRRRSPICRSSAAARSRNGLASRCWPRQASRRPEGALARSADEAVATAKKIGYPVAMKAQAAALAHKTEAGGVLLNIADDAGVRAAWQKLHDNIERHSPGMKLDGVLVEKMSARGLELVVGAKRDPQWGPVVLVGLGGVMVEALGDVRLLPADLSEAGIVDELHKLKAAKLLGPFRGQPAVDVEAVAKVAAALGRLMRTVPEIMEIDVNPLIALAKGRASSRSMR